MLEAFGGIRTEERVVKMVQKEEEDPKKKALALKKTESEPPKLVDVLQKLTNYSEFERAINTLKEFDIALARLGHVKSTKLATEVQEIE